MIEKEIAELRRRLRPDKSGVSHVRGCYVNANGEIIPGLYAAGEVTGGIHGGNRLGGNAIVEIFVSGRTAANTIAEENK